MPLVKLQFKPGINKEITNYANEGGWISTDKTRFRSGYPEKLGGWINYSPNFTFNGVARSIFNWVTYENENLLGLGTNQKYYIENGGQYYDITPIAYTNTLTNPFTTAAGSALITVVDTSFDSTIGTFVTYSGATTFNGVTLNGSYEIISVSGLQYQIISPVLASNSGSGGGTVTATYQLNAGNATYSAGTGWGIGPWGISGWGSATMAAGIPLQLWSQTNYNESLVMAIRGGPVYYWAKDTVSYAPAVTLGTWAATQVKTTMPASFTGGSPTLTVTDALQIDVGATVSGNNIQPGTTVSIGYNGGLVVPLSLATIGPSSGNYNFSYSGGITPTETFQILGSSTYGFIIAMGSTPYDPTNFNPNFDPMRVRWSDQSNAAEWTPTTYNQAGEQRLSNGSYIVGSISTRQEILIWTDTSLYSMQYLGPPYTFGFTSLMDNISTVSPNCMVSVSGITYWMGIDKFYIYTGIVNTLPCSIRKFVFTNINLSQSFQIVSGFNERFNEVWWFYPSLTSQINDSYVIYNYMENLWYYGTLNRSAWLDSALRPYPMAAYSTQNSYLANNLGAGDTSLTLIDGFSYPNAGTLIIDQEQMTYTSRTNNSFTGVTRGVNQTTAAPHNVYTIANNLIPNQVLFHEDGVDDNSYPPSVGPVPIVSYIQSSDFDIGDGQHYAFVWRALPDFAFLGSSAPNPQIFLTVQPRQNSGTPYQTGVDTPVVTSSSTYPIELFTGEIFTRVRGRQMALNISSPNQGVQWQMGALRFDIRPDGRR